MVSIRWRDPLFDSSFGDLSRLRAEMNRLFESFFPSERVRFGAGVFPPVNIYETDDAVIVTAEVPGMDPQEIDISMQGDNLVLKGERKTDAGEGASFHRRERRYGAFNRVLALPERVDPEKVEAEYANGVLKITLPKAEEAKPKKIEVKVG